MNRSQILSNLCEANKFFANTEYEKIVQKAWLQLNSDKSTKPIQETLDRLPSEKQLLAQLIEKLKGKSVHSTLVRLGKHKNPVKEAKALSSLLTHAIISVEQGETEYLKLFPILLTKINSKVYEIIQ